jgi:ACT domain-containing protein
MTFVPLTSKRSKTAITSLQIPLTSKEVEHAKLYKKNKMTRAIITVVGKDTVGIIAKVCTYLADNQINILDISQTIVQEFFNMMMIVDLTKSVKPFDQLNDELVKIGKDTGVQVKCQLEDIFDKMHRI